METLQKKAKESKPTSMSWSRQVAALLAEKLSVFSPVMCG
jgi:hypothetical protein